MVCVLEPPVGGLVPQVCALEPQVDVSVQMVEELEPRVDEWAKPTAWSLVAMLVSLEQQ